MMGNRPDNRITLLSSIILIICAMYNFHRDQALFWFEWILGVAGFIVWIFQERNR